MNSTIVLLPNHNSSEASALAERIRSTLEEHVFKINDSHEKLTVSIGMASWPNHGASFHEIIQAANNAKKEAKSCKNTVKLFQTASSDR